MTTTPAEAPGVAAAAVAGPGVDAGPGPSVTTLGTWESEDVTVGQVEAALSDLRRHEQRAAVRTSVLTLIVVVEDADEANEVVSVVHQLGAQHPSRTIVLVVGDAGTGTGLDAHASVHVVERTGMAVCFEDVVLTVRGKARHHLDSVVEPFTLPDLPVVVWLPSRLPSPGDPLLSTIDRLVVDSRAVADENNLLERIARLARRLPVTDLSWTRLSPWRTQLTSLFEGAVARPFLTGVTRVDVAGNFGPRYMLGGWLLRRLALPTARVVVTPAPHVSIRISAFSEGRRGTFVVERRSDERVLGCSIDIDGGPCVSQVLHMRERWPSLSLADALTRMGRDETYRQALDGALALRKP